MEVKEWPVLKRVLGGKIKMKGIVSWLSGICCRGPWRRSRKLGCRGGGMVVAGVEGSGAVEVEHG